MTRVMQIVAPIIGNGTGVTLAVDRGDITPWPH